MRPAAGVPAGSGEGVGARNVAVLGDGEAARGHDAEARDHRLAAVGGHGPAPAVLVIDGGCHPRLQLDVGAQVKTVGHMVEVGEQLGLGGVALGPRPRGVELGREGVAVLLALDIHARAGIAVPIPGAADAGTGFVDPGRNAELAQPVQQVETREPGPHDHHVIGLSVAHPGSPVVAADDTRPGARRQSLRDGGEARTPSNHKAKPAQPCRSGQRTEFKMGKWWTRLGLNQRPPRCQRGALPLSYASVRGRAYSGDPADRQGG